MKSIIESILDKMPELTKVRKQFLIHIFALIVSLRGRMNFLNMERQGTYSEKSYRLHFEQSFDHFAFNKHLIATYCSGNKIIAADCSYIPKSGKETPHIGKFWSGCASKALKGLEISSLAVIDVDNNTGMHLECKQTTESSNDEESRVDFYLQQVIDKKDELKQLADYIVADGAYAKQKYVDGLLEKTELHLISKLRKDADLTYLYTGEMSKGRGRKKQYDGKMNCKQIDKSRFELCCIDEDSYVYTAVVRSKFLKRNIRIAYVEHRKNNSYSILFSTDTKLGGDFIYRYYKARFQIEFLFRDAKQYTGLNHCQARSENKLDFHFNASLTAVSLSKTDSIFKEPLTEEVFSMCDIKTINFNQLLLDRFIAISEVDPSCNKIAEAYDEMLKFGRIAA
ncbi:MAG: transposase [Desulfamplus sp.]|nr:transposase [Desulfamplus sp.]